MLGGIFAKTIQKAAESTIEIQDASSMLGPRCVKIEDLEAPMFSFASPFFPGDTTIHMNHKKANNESLVGHMSGVVIGVGIAALIRYAVNIFLPARLELLNGLFGLMTCHVE